MIHFQPGSSSGGGSAVDVTDRLIRQLGRVVVVDSANLEKLIAARPGSIEVIVGGAVIDPRVIRALTAADVVTLAAIAQLPAALVGGRLDTNIGAWLGAVTPTVGQKTMAASLPVALASDQTTFPAVAEQRAAILHVTGTAAVNTALTITLPAAGAGLFHYITSIQWFKRYSVIGVAAGAGTIITSTNLPGNPAWDTEQLAAPPGTVVRVIDYQAHGPLRSLAANTATTIVAPLQLQTIWRGNVSYFVAP